METEKLKDYALLGKVLWTDKNKQEHYLSETLANSLLSKLDEEERFEHATRRILELATDEGLATSLSGIAEPFYQLPVRDRFMVAARHLNGWTYEKLCRILGFAQDQLETELWNARLRLVTKLGGGGEVIRYPTASGMEGPSCPEYHPRHPWTQKYLDLELRGEEKLFVQTHVEKCQACQGTLAATRAVFEKTEKLLPKPMIFVQDMVDRLVDVQEKIERYRPGTDLSAAETFKLYLQRRPWMQVYLLFFLGYLIWAFFFS